MVELIYFMKEQIAVNHRIICVAVMCEVKLTDLSLKRCFLSFVCLLFSNNSHEVTAGRPSMATDIVQQWKLSV